MTASIRLLQAACVFAVLASVAGDARRFYATAVRADWPGVAYGGRAAIVAAASGAGLVFIDAVYGAS